MHLQTFKVGLVSMLVLGHAGFAGAKESAQGRSLSGTSAESAAGLLLLSVMGSAVSLSGWEG